MTFRDVAVLAGEEKHCPTPAGGADMFTRFVPRDEVVEREKQDRKVARNAEGGRSMGKSRATFELEHH